MQRALLWWLLTLLWMAVIFHFTATPVYTGERTGAVIEQLAPGGFTQEMIHRTNLLLRKSAHLFLFAGLGLLAHQAIVQSLAHRYAPLWAWLVATLYAVSDEWHQTLVPGRSGQLQDVLLDSAAAAAALLIVVGGGRLMSRHRQRRQPRITP